MNSLEKNWHSSIRKKFPKGGIEVAPSGQLAVVKNGRKVGEYHWGKSYKYFDLASLTKIIFGASSMMYAEDRGWVRASDRVSRWIPEFPFNGIQLSQLLSHSAGFAPWFPFYKSVESREELFPELVKKGRTTSKASVYSDLDFLYLSYAIEEIFEKPLHRCWTELKNEFPRTTLHFNQNNTPRYRRSEYAPTENCKWRKKRLQGEVHDDNTWSIGGVSTHAGLFGTMDDVLTWGRSLRRICLGESSWSSKTKYLKRVKGDWSLGFMMPGRQGSSTGKYFSKQTVGHLGFTGTSFWFDPKADLMVVLLTNRVAHSRNHKKIRQFRPFVHNLVYETVVGK